MKHYKHAYFWLFLLIALCVASCQEDDLDTKSIFDDGVEMEKNEFDHWLDRNYLYPYNVDFKYRMEDIESDLSYNLVPADYHLSIKLAKIVKHMWFEAYDEAGGIDFTRKYAPKVIHLVGSAAWNKGTFTLGTAEGGLKVTLYLGNWLNPTNIPELNNYYFGTMHHEFAHILHQSIDYPVEYNTLSEGHYSPTGWQNRKTMAEYAPFGFVTNYASSQPGEDIAEVTARYLTWTDAEWEALEAGAGEEGWSIILQKIEIVKKYMKDNYNINIDELREIIDRRGSELQSMDLDDLRH